MRLTVHEEKIIKIIVFTGGWVSKYYIEYRENDCERLEC